MLNTATAEGFLLIALGTVSGLALTGGIQGGVRVEKGDDGVLGKKIESLGGVAHGHVQGKEHDLQGQRGRWAESKHAIPQYCYSRCKCQWMQRAVRNKPAGLLLPLKDAIQISGTGNA